MDEERAKLRALVAKPTTEQRYVQRAKIPLLAEEGFNNEEIGERIGMHPVTVGDWRKRFAKERLAGLHDKPRPGRNLVHTHEVRLNVITTATQPPENTSHWSLSQLAAKVGLPKSTVHGILHEAELQPHRVEMWLHSKDPNFAAKEADVVGLYLNPPENAVVFSVDEKTQLQCNTPKAPDLPMKPGMPMKREFEYKRYGVVNLFTAFNVKTGEVTAEAKDRKRHMEFLEFMTALEKRTPPEKVLHVIIDNLSAHKTPEVMAWLAEHSRVHFHFTPTHASWLNQVEVWFSILGKRLLKRGYFTGKADMVQKILKYIEEYNKTAKPFAWTYAGKPLVVN